MATARENVLATEIAAYASRKDDLERAYPGKFVVFKGTELIGSWDTLNAAAAEATHRFGRPVSDSPSWSA